MHIMEGFLPVEHAVGWTLAAAPFVSWGVRSLRRQFVEQPEQRMLLGSQPLSPSSCRRSSCRR